MRWFQGTGGAEAQHSSDQTTSCVACAEATRALAASPLQASDVPQALRAKQIGVVAHLYLDPEVVLGPQGTGGAGAVHDTNKTTSFVLGACTTQDGDQIPGFKPPPHQHRTVPQALRTKKIGVVAHFYMDPEVQGVLTAAREQWPHIHISDSLVMADSAVRMAEAGCKAVAVLGVDFMSENVRAILDEAGYQGVPVRALLCTSWFCLGGCCTVAVLCLVCWSRLWLWLWLCWAWHKPVYVWQCAGKPATRGCWYVLASTSLCVLRLYCNTEPCACS